MVARDMVYIDCEMILSLAKWSLQTNLDELIAPLQRTPEFKMGMGTSMAHAFYVQQGPNTLQMQLLAVATPNF
jgi:hypothetical protein